MIKKLLLALTGITFITAAVLTAPLYASNCAKGAHEKKQCEANCLKGLNEKDQQAAKVQIDKYFESISELKKNLTNKKADLKAELSKNAPDRKAAYKLHEEISNLKAQLGVKKIDFVLELKKINPDIKCPKMMGKCAKQKGAMCCPMKNAKGNQPPPGCPAHKKTSSN